MRKRWGWAASMSSLGTRFGTSTQPWVSRWAAASVRSMGLILSEIQRWLLEARRTMRRVRSLVQSQRSAFLLLNLVFGLTVLSELSIRASRAPHTDVARGPSDLSRT